MAASDSYCRALWARGQWREVAGPGVTPGLHQVLNRRSEDTPGVPWAAARGVSERAELPLPLINQTSGRAT